MYTVHTQTKNCFGDLCLNCENKQSTPSVCSLPDRHPVLQVFSNLLPWYSSTTQLCCLLLPFSGALLAPTPCFHTSITDAAHKMRLFRRKEHVRSSEQRLFAFIISYLPYCHREERQAAIYYMTEIRVSWTSWHPFLALPPRGSSVCRYAKPLVIECAKRQELTQSLVWRLKYLHKEP